MRGSHAHLSLILTCLFSSISQAVLAADIGKEVSMTRHLQDGEELTLPLHDVLVHGKKLFLASWTNQEGAGRPLFRGDPTAQAFPRNFNRVSAPDANSCAGCHNAPFGIPGGGGDFVGNVFVLGARFEFATFDHNNLVVTSGSLDEERKFVTLQTIANSRSTVGMFGSGFIEMLARQITMDLQQIRDAIPPGGSSPLLSKGISFGVLQRLDDGTWDTSAVEGLPLESLVTTGSDDPPNLILRPFQQSGSVVSLREFSNNAFNFHHGIQSEERFGLDVDADMDGFANELTRADVTAISIYQATMAVPGRVIPNNPEIEKAVLLGEERFDAIGCTHCHIPSLPLDKEGWIFSEPNPFNPPGNLQLGQAPELKVDLTSKKLPLPRLKINDGVVQVPAYTDFKLHNITSSPDDPNVEELNMNMQIGSRSFFAGNAFFLTRKLWGTANDPPYFHHGQYTTLREAILAHAGEAAETSQAFRNLPRLEQDSIVEFLKTLRVLPPGTKSLVVDQKGNRKKWPPHKG